MSRKESMKYTGTEIIYRFNKETGEYEEIGNADTFVKPIGRTEPFMITYLAEIINLIDTLGNKKMQVVKYILMALYIIDCLGLIIVTMMQNSDSRGASGTIVGSSSNNFYEKNKGRTREGKLKRWTIILGVAFIVLAVALGIVYVIK